MRKLLPKFRKHINKHSVETMAICSVTIIVSVLQIVVVSRDRIVQKLLEETHNDTIVKILYFDKMRDPNLAYALGEYNFGGGVYDIEKAKKYFTRAAELDQKMPLVHYQLARIYFVTGDQTKALQEINKELEYHPNFMRSHYIRGLIYGYSNQLPLAVEDFKQFLAWKPNSWAGHNDLAWVYFQQGDFENSYLVAQDGLRYSPGNPWLLNTVGISLKNLGDIDGAREAFETSLSNINRLTPESWGNAYPGNDPDFYQKGFSNMKQTVENNLQLIQTSY